MDSLFDGSLFDATPYEAVLGPSVEPDPPENEQSDPAERARPSAPGSDVDAMPPIEPVEREEAVEEAEAHVVGADVSEADGASAASDGTSGAEPTAPDGDGGRVARPEAPNISSPAFAALLGHQGSPDAGPEPEFDEAMLREPSVDELWVDVVGQERAVAQLRASTLTPVHAYLLSGPPGVGKLAAARAFASALLCPRGGCGHCSVCIRAQAQAHPDLVVVEREGASISVDQAREILRLALRSPVEGERKVLVLVDFHLVTIAAPTLLKIIEEPPPSTVFIVLAEQVTPELVTIASRCVRVPFSALSRATIVDTLIGEGAASVHAARAAEVAGGRLDRARLLVNDPALGPRLEFWERLPARLDGTGAAVSVIAAETVELLDGAAGGPLVDRQQAEVAALDARLEASGSRGSAGVRKELADRHKREQKRVRDDELRFGLGVLIRQYGAVLASGGDGARGALDAIAVINATNEHLERNPNLALLLQSLYLRLPVLSR